MMKPVFTKLEAAHPEVGFYKVDVDEQEEIAAEWYVPIRSESKGRRVIAET